MDLTTFTPASALVTVIVLALAPFVAVMVTSFTKIIVVLSLLRNALGLQQVPPNVVLNGLAIVLSVYVMFPVALKIGERVGPMEGIGGSTKSLLSAVDKGKEPLRDFLVKHSNPRERNFFLRTAQKSLDPAQAAQVTERDFIIVLPAFTVRELSTAFQIGFLIFLPFLVIDLVVSNILMAMGMQMLTPTTVSLPFKLLLFVLVDGWVKLSHGVVSAAGGGGRRGGLVDRLHPSRHADSRADLPVRGQVFRHRADDFSHRVFAWRHAADLHRPRHDRLPGHGDALTPPINIPKSFER
jgi:type III secretion protein R